MQEQGIDQDKAQRLIDSFLDRFPGRVQGHAMPVLCSIHRAKQSDSDSRHVAQTAAACHVALALCRRASMPTNTQQLECMQ
jgi:hypothetical protein